MPLRLIHDKSPLYNKQLNATGEITETDIDTALHKHEHARFLCRYIECDYKEYEHAVLEIVHRTREKLLDVRNEGNKAHGMLLVFNYSNNELFDELYVGKEKKKFVEPPSMLTSIDKFIDAMREIATSENYHDGAVLIGSDGNVKKLGVYIDVWLHALNKGYKLPYSDKSHNDLIARSGLQRFDDSGMREISAFGASLIMADGLVAVIRENLVNSYVLKNGFLLWPKDFHPSIDYNTYLQKNDLDSQVIDNEVENNFHC